MTVSLMFPGLLRRIFPLFFGALMVVAPEGLQAQQSGRSGGSAFPEFENEFYNDFATATSSAQKIEITRNLRIAAESSQIHPVVVVIRRVSDYPGLPQDVHAMALQLARERKVGSQKTRQGLLALFALDDRKFSVAHSDNVAPKVSEAIRDAFNRRVRDKLREGQVGQALVYASEDMASVMPKATVSARGANAASPSQSAQSVPVASGLLPQRATVPVEAPGSEKLAKSGDAKPGDAKASGWGIGTWILVIFGGYLVISLLRSLFSGGGAGAPGGMGGGGFGGGGGPGWGGMLGGLLGGGLLGYWLGNHSSHASDNSSGAGGRPQEGGGGLFGGGEAGGDSGSSDSGGFDSFGGGDYSGGGSDGGGADGDW